VYNLSGGGEEVDTGMRVRLYYSSDHTPLSVPYNKGFELNEVLDLLKELERQSRLVYETVDTSELSDHDLREAYIAAMAPAIIKGRTGYNIKRVFGSRRLSGIHFGKGIPALLVYEESEHPRDVYPHRLGQIPITIKEFLENLAE
jgi:hypothetical protein